MLRKPWRSPAVKTAGSKHTGPRVLHQTLRDARRTNLSLLEETIGWSYNALLTGVMVLHKGDYWLVVIKAVFETGPMVSYIDCEGFGRACEVAIELADARALRWKKDKKPLWTRKKRRIRRSFNSLAGGP